MLKRVSQFKNVLFIILALLNTVQAEEWRTITRVEARPFKVDREKQSEAPILLKNALGREFIAVDESPSLLRSEEGPWQTFDCRRGDYFDIWSLLRSMQGAAPHDGVLLRFSFDSPAVSHVALGVGFCDSAAIWVNDSLQCHIRGKRDINDNENIVYFDSIPGKNFVEMLLWKSDRHDAIPENTFENEWAVKIALAQNKNQRPAIPSGTVYLLDTPVAQSFEALRSSIFFGEEKTAEILNSAGEKIGDAWVNKIGQFQKFTKATLAEDGTPFLGYIRIDNHIEPILIANDFNGAIDDYVRGLIPTSIDNSNPWHYRANHLIRPQFSQQRDRWWARKLVAACAKIATISRGVPLTDFGRTGPRMEFGSYRSSIDGTIQHYQYFKAPTSKSRRKALIVLQAAPLPVRPFLESPGVADIKETELLLRNAAEFEMDVIVPGNVDIDYGGALSRAWVSEAINHCLADQYKGEDVDLYVVGTCAAGVGAVNLTKVLPTTGLILWSPVVHRLAYRWPLGGDSNLDLAPRSLWMEDRKIPTLFKKGTPVFLIYDIDVKGHGDRNGVKSFASAIRSEQGSISERWLSKPDPVLQWGLRGGASQREWMSWAARLAGGQATSTKRALAEEAFSSVDFFWQGFELGSDENEISRQLCELVRNEIGLYRGTPPPVKDIETAKFKIKASPRATILTKAKELLRDQAALAALDGTRPLLLIHPTGERGAAEMNITADTAYADLPKIDPWKECFSLVILWQLVDRKWVVVSAN